MDDFTKYIHQMQPKLPELFGLLPKAPVTVEPIPDFAKAEATHYVAGTPDGKRPGRVVVAVADPTKRTLVDDEAVAYHEGVPGHHMQISIAQTLPDLPKFRLHGFYSAYAEGWALYSEELGKEIGFYKDPVSDYGRLNSELFRAVRLVVDTGIHDKNWSREKVIDYMHANDTERRAGADRDRPLHRLAGAGAGLQDGAAHDSQAARRSQGAARTEVRHQSIPRRNPERRSDAAGSAAGARGAMDQGAGTGDAEPRRVKDLELSAPAAHRRRNAVSGGGKV